MTFSFFLNFLLGVFLPFFAQKGDIATPMVFWQGGGGHCRNWKFKGTSQIAWKLKGINVFFFLFLFISIPIRNGYYFFKNFMLTHLHRNTPIIHNPHPRFLRILICFTSAVEKIADYHYAFETR
jgi:hypothetical protein